MDKSLARWAKLSTANFSKSLTNEVSHLSTLEAPGEWSKSAKSTDLGKKWWTSMTSMFKVNVDSAWETKVSNSSLSRKARERRLRLVLMTSKRLFWKNESFPKTTFRTFFLELNIPRNEGRDNFREQPVKSRLKKSKSGRCCLKAEWLWAEVSIKKLFSKQYPLLVNASHFLSRLTFHQSQTSQHQEPILNAIHLPVNATSSFLTLNRNEVI